jgi:predicted nucleotide-binding protein (sugar kinase/HSP70/actin superfamily)
MKETYKGIQIQTYAYSSVVNHVKFNFGNEMLISGMISEVALLRSAKRKIDYLLGDVNEVSILTKIRLSIASISKLFKRRAKNNQAKKSRKANRK